MTTYLLKNRDCLIEMVMFHCRCAVDSSQRRFCIQHELIVFAPMVQIMAQ